MRPPHLVRGPRRTSRGDRQHHLAPPAWREAARERLARRSEWKDLDERGTQIAAIDHPRERAELVGFGSPMKESPPSGGPSATETSPPPARSTARERRTRSPPTVSKTTSTG